MLSQNLAPVLGYLCYLKVFRYFLVGTQYPFCLFLKDINFFWSPSGFQELTISEQSKIQSISEFLEEKNGKKKSKIIKFCMYWNNLWARVRLKLIRKCMPWLFSRVRVRSGSGSRSRSRKQWPRIWVASSNLRRFWPLSTDYRCLRTQTTKQSITRSP